MAITTKTTASYKQLLRFARDLRKEALKDLRKKINVEITELMADGISPTQGGAWHSEYSQRYKRQIAAGKYRGKSISPVNLRLTGKMYRSLSAKSNLSKGTMTLKFNDSEKALKHDKGVGRLPVRRLLPNDGEKFHANIRALIVRSVKNFAVKLAKKASDR